MRLSSRLLIGFVFTFGLLSFTMGGSILIASAQSFGPGHKVTICHRTNSETNPYVVNSPAIDSIVKGEGHDGHNGPIWAPGDKANGIEWGDIIPAFSYSGVSQDIYGGHYPGKNWTAAGQSILAHHCKVEVVSPPSPTPTHTATPSTSPSSSPSASPSSSPSASPSPSPSASPSPSPSASPSPSSSPSPSPSASPSAPPSVSPSSPAVGGAAAGASPTPQGTVLAETGSSGPGQGLGAVLATIGLIAMIAGALMRRRPKVG